MLNETEQKRINKLKTKNIISNEKIDYFDFILLLKHDAELQQLIRSLILNDDLKALTITSDNQEQENVIEKIVEVEKVVEVEKIIEIEKIVEVEKIVTQTIELEDPICDELKSQFLLLDWLKSQPVLMQCMNLQSSFSQGKMLLVWCAFSSNLDNIIMLWQQFSEQCSNEKRSVTDQELQCLKLTIQQHNLNYQQHNVTLETVPEGAVFDFEKHKRIITAQGNNVEQCCLPALVDIRNQQLCKPLVKTY
ncbi:hypothetical protein VXS06_01165 [Photobacterium toruni]|uniref:Uncharacterized protein n=1 Tax=Photobacterium toruni TaxID=1935446 RepID=A0ABU6L343_9GAMM|nr:hypothetical protein [Photobacterium toruni]